MGSGSGPAGNGIHFFNLVEGAHESRLTWDQNRPWLEMAFKNVVKKTQPNQPTKQKSDIELMPYICKYLFECWNAENQGR